MKLLIDESLAVFLWHQTAEAAASAEPPRDPNQSSACRLWTTTGLRPGFKPKKRIHCHHFRGLYRGFRDTGYLPVYFQGYGILLILLPWI